MSYTEKIIDLCKQTKQLNIIPFAQSFRWCNNHCEFCYLKDYMFDKPISLKEIDCICNNVLSWLKENLNKLPNDTKFTLSLIGGELFCLNEDYYNKYKHLIDEVSISTCT